MVQVVGSKLYTLPFELLSIRSVCVCVDMRWGAGQPRLSLSYYQDQYYPLSNHSNVSPKHPQTQMCVYKTTTNTQHTSHTSMPWCTKKTNKSYHSYTHSTSTILPASVISAARRSPSITLCTNRNGASYMWDWNASQQREAEGFICINLTGQNMSSEPPHSSPR